jgi:hypothetical protein
MVYPLLPAILEGVIRFIALDHVLRLDTVNSATLAMSVALIAVFVNQSIRTDESRVSDEDEEASRNGTCTFFTATAIIFFALFGVLTLLGTLITDKGMPQLKPTLEAFQGVAFAISTVPIVAAIAAQRTFKLRASLV